MMSNSTTKAHRIMNGKKWVQNQHALSYFFRSLTQDLNLCPFIERKKVSFDTEVIGSKHSIHHQKLDMSLED